MNILAWFADRQETPESRKYLADDARQLLENRLLQAAFAKVGEALELAALSCDPDNRDRAARIVISKQLLAGVRRELERCVEDGDVAVVQLAELERQKRPVRFMR